MRSVTVLMPDRKRNVMPEKLNGPVGLMRRAVKLLEAEHSANAIIEDTASPFGCGGKRGGEGRTYVVILVRRAVPK